MLVSMTRAANRLSIKTIFSLFIFFLFPLNSFSSSPGAVLNFDGGEESGSFFPGAKADFPTPTPEVVSSAEAPKTPVCDFRVYFIDVGMGDSEYIQLPNCKNVLIDGGPSSVASSKLAKFLNEHKIASIDYVLLTHPHADHFKGLMYVFSNLTVSNFYDTRQDNSESSTLQKFRELARNEPGVNISYPSTGSSLDWDPLVEIKVLHGAGAANDSLDGETLNNSSIVIKMTYQDASVLFMGDAQSDVEKQLVEKYGEGLKADVLKVGHHGSATSSTDEFLKAVAPKAAYVSVGKNSYGLPSASAIERLKNHGAAVYRTDSGGTMEYLAAEGMLDEVQGPFQPEPWAWPPER